MYAEKTCTDYKKDFYDHVLELIVHPMISVQTNNGREIINDNEQLFQKQPNVNSEIKRKKEETNVNNYEVSGIKRQKTAACRTKTIVSDQIRDGYTIAERQIDGERIVGRICTSPSCRHDPSVKIPQMNNFPAKNVDKLYNKPFTKGKICGSCLSAIISKKLRIKELKDDGSILCVVDSRREAGEKKQELCYINE